MSIFNVVRPINVAVGTKVKTLKVGDRVALEPGVSCGVCDCCKRGRYQVSPGGQKTFTFSLTFFSPPALP